MSPLWDTFSGSLRSTEYRAPHSRPLPFLIVQTLLCARTSVCGDWLHVVLTVQMPKVVKQSTAWSGVDTLVKNFLASLPLVSDLHHPSMRDLITKVARRRSQSIGAGPAQASTD